MIGNLNQDVNTLVGVTVTLSLGFILAEIIIKNTITLEFDPNHPTILKIKDVLTKRLLIILTLALSLMIISLNSVEVNLGLFGGFFLAIPAFTTYYKIVKDQYVNTLTP